jgi:hypothetical protein
MSYITYPGNITYSSCCAFPASSRTIWPTLFHVFFVSWSAFPTLTPASNTPFSTRKKVYAITPNYICRSSFNPHFQNQIFGIHELEKPSNLYSSVVFAYTVTRQLFWALCRLFGHEDNSNWKLFELPDCYNFRIKFISVRVYMKKLWFF